MHPSVGRVPRGEGRAERSFDSRQSPPHLRPHARRMAGMWRNAADDDTQGDSGSTSVLEREEQLITLDEGDHERFSHFVQKEKILESAVTGAPVIALCGKVWTPGRDPEKFPVCPTCKEIYESLNE